LPSWACLTALGTGCDEGQTVAKLAEASGSNSGNSTKSSNCRNSASNSDCGAARACVSGRSDARARPPDSVCRGKRWRLPV